MEPSPRETRVALTEPHMGQCRLYYSTYNWGDEEESSCSPWFPCHCSVSQLSKRGKIKSPQCVWQMETALSKKSWPLSLEMDTFIGRLMYLAYWWLTWTKTDLFHFIQSYVVYHLDVKIIFDQDYQFEVGIFTNH